MRFAPLPRCCLSLLVLMPLLALSPHAYASDEAWIPGFGRRIAGEILSYHSPQPDIDRSLLVRSLDSERSIAWETAPVPRDHEGEWATFVWAFGIDANVERHTFELRIAGETWFHFRTPLNADVTDWVVTGRDGAELRFRATMIDRFDDLMGYAVVRLPRSVWSRGKPVRLEVVGESANSRTWYMTFMASIEESARAASRPVLVREREQLRRRIRLDVVHLRSSADATVETSFGTTAVHRLRFGSNAIELSHPDVDGPQSARVDVKIEGGPHHILECAVEPLREWTIYLVQHTHTDIGYTRPQSEILPEHLRFLDSALEFCDRTDSYPEEARFRWTCEASWAVREYLRSRTREQVERFRRRVEEGRIEVTGMFLNMSEVVDEASYAAFLAPIRTFREAGLSVTTAMQNDINGAAWCLADYFSQIGIDYLTMGQHGHRALVPFDKATSFWWESPAGNRVLAFRADHYLTGNFWGVHTGRVDAVEDELLRYLRTMEDRGYPFDRVAVQYSGYPTDNSSPSMTGSELVRQWNERFVWPRLRCATAREFPEWVSREHGEELPVLRVAWPDWWTDGFGSAARESAVARIAQADLVGLEGLLAMQELQGLDVPDTLRDEISDVRDSLLFYGEHTFGAAESIREPFSENSVVQWAQKSAYAWEAVKRAAVLREGILARFDECLPHSSGARLVVFNTAGFTRSGLLEIYVDHDLLPIDRPFRILDEDRRSVPVRKLRSRDDGSYWALWVDGVPAFGSRVWNVEIEDADVEDSRSSEDGDVLENHFYRVHVDASSGAIQSLYDKELDLELVDPDAEWKLGQIVYETLGNREQLEAFHLEDYERQSLSAVEIEGITSGPIWQSLSIRGELPTCEAPRGVRLEIRLFHDTKRLELHFLARKRRNFDPESIYVAFPFRLPESRILYETLGGIATPGEDLLPGAASDWQAIQGFAAVQAPDAQVVLTSREIPLVQLGGINTGRFQPIGVVEKSHIYSWVMNNYWTTNFKASQEGDFRWSYALTSSSDVSRGFASRFGWESRVSLLGRVAPGGDGKRTASVQSLIPLELTNLLLVTARPASNLDGVVLHLREVEGRESTLSIETWRYRGELARVQTVTVLEDVLETLAGEVHFRPHETKFLLVISDSGGEENH